MHRSQLIDNEVRWDCRRLVVEDILLVVELSAVCRREPNDRIEPAAMGARDNLAINLPLVEPIGRGAQSVPESDLAEKLRPQPSVRVVGGGVAEARR